MELRRSGRVMLFLDISIGEPFWAHNKVRIKTAYEAATVLGSAERLRHHSCCNFNIDECDRKVEAVDFFIDGVKM